MTLKKFVTVKEIFNQIKNLKYIFICILTLFVVCTIYFVFNNNIKWKASIELRSIDTHLASQYKLMEAVNQSVIRSINNIEKNILALQEEDEARFFSLIAKQSDSTEINEGNSLFMENYEESLLLILIDQVLRKEIVVDVLDELSLFNKSEFNSLDEYYSHLNHQAVQFKTIPPIVTPENKQIFKRDYYPNWRVSFVANDKEMAKNTILKVLEVSNNNVQKFLISSFKEYLEVIKIPYNEKVATLDRRKSLLINQYDMSRENTIAFLEEQATLARSLGYDKNMKESQNIIINIPLSISSMRDSEGEDFYLRGYEFIESQIDLLNQRDEDFEKYIPELIQTDSLIMAIENHRDSTISKFEETFNSTPVFKDSFISAMYNSADINIDRIGVTNIEIIILSILFTFAFCFFVLVISLVLNVLKKEINN